MVKFIRNQITFKILIIMLYERGLYVETRNKSVDANDGHIVMEQYAQ